MSDITPHFNQLLDQRGAEPAGNSSRARQLDKFLQEAHRINKHIFHLHNELRDIRQAYLATAQSRRTLRARDYANTRNLTDREREEIDVTAKRSIRELTASIQELEQAAELMRNADAAMIQKQHGSRLGALGSWASGGVGGSRKTAEHVRAEEAVSGVATHRESVVAYLRHRLEACCRIQQGMMEKRLVREMERNRSVLARAGPSQFHHAPISNASHHLGPKVPADTAQMGSASLESESTVDAASQGLTPEQLQMFEKGNQEMMEQMETELGKIRSAQQSLFEIAQLQNTLMSNLTMQKEQIGLLTEDQYSAEDNVKGGNKELAKAAQRPSAARYTFFAASAISTFLVLWDLFI